MCDDAKLPHTEGGRFFVAEDIDKSALMANMTENLMVLRNKLHLTQVDLAGKVGISRQTLVNIESKKRDMSWNTFVALVCVFREDDSTNDLLEHFGIYTTELSRYLTSSDSASSDKR
jgi:DNA-binding XRE family transcriptional regulator